MFFSMAVSPDRFKDFVFSAIAELSEFWEQYTSFVINVDHTTALSRAILWWQAHMLIYYAQARWVVFISVLAYWRTITVEGNVAEGVGHITAASKA
jgi:hypothetical protein